ncbi:hypothetical protein GQ43DRAFT_435223 [Delitschia confertaspora ATCC 74209]|uniref:Uncharacterized protein n=1 Tax=Delitschia confertaspora ATCC 74209 TaxID=1513339 RepID=A0A9P4JHL8_9PLEO|nr:hypothetical protein GQ43DRAFT_435223 [Delitschia confertaspora ATCC 74209]
MAPLPDSILSLLPRSLFPSVPTAISIIERRSLSPMAVNDLHHLTRRAEHIDPGAGSRPAKDFNNKGFQALFALIGVGMVLGSIWFFFWAKNGGFKWREGDWEDYKSTVLRRKGPDGKTLSNATKSTKLGGGSVVHGGSYGAESSIGYTDETASSAGFTEMREVEAGHAGGLRGGDARKKRRHRDKSNYKDPELREYRHEKPARVGGLNRQADGTYTDYSATGTEPSEITSNVSYQPLIKEKGKEMEKELDKKEAKAKKARAIARMKEAQRKEKEESKRLALEAKAAKAAEKALLKREKAEQKKNKKHRRGDGYTEATPSEYPGTEYPATEYATEYPPTEYPPTEYQTEAAPSEAPPKRHSSRAPRRAPPSAAYSFVTGDDAETTYTGAYTATQSAPSEAVESSYYSEYRPHAEVNRNRESRRESRSRPAGSRSRPSSSSPKKHRVPPASDIFTAALGDENGTKAYPCHIPGLSQYAESVGVSESVSQVGGPSGYGGRKGRDVMDGYRRGGVRGVGRRDSLSDSDRD